MRIRKNDALMRIVTRRYVPHAGYIDYGFDGDTLLHSGKYIKYPKNSNCQRWMKRETSRKFRNCQDLPRKGNYYRRLFDYWWTLYLLKRGFLQRNMREPSRFLVYISFRRL